MQKTVQLQPLGRLDRPPEHPWKRAPKHVLRALRKVDRRLHMYWHDPKKVWRVVEFLMRSKTWSHVFWWYKAPQVEGILRLIRERDQQSQGFAEMHPSQRVRAFEAGADRELDRVRAADAAEIAYVKKQRHEMARMANGEKVVLGPGVARKRKFLHAGQNHQEWARKMQKRNRWRLPRG